MTLHLSLGLILSLVAVLVAGCEDDRGAVDIGGMSPEAGAGGQWLLDGCPRDVPAAVGTPCHRAFEGDRCQDEDHDYPCGLEGAIRCESGTWVWLEPLCGEGGAGGHGGLLDAGAGTGGAG